MQRWIAALDRFQQRHRPTAVAFAVSKKFGDDQGGHLCALMTYYAFVSIFPLLLVLVTVLGYVLQDRPALRADILDSALAEFPVLGDQLRNNLTSVRGNGIALVIGVLVTFYGGLGVAGAAQAAMNRVWEVPVRDHPGFFPRLARSIALIGTFGAGVIVTTLVSGAGGEIVRRFGPGFGFAAVVVLGLALNLVLFVAAFRFLTTASPSTRDVLPGALVAAVGWEALQLLGGAYVTRVLHGMSQTYGVFALVLGLLAWLFLLVRVVVYAAELNAVLVMRLWPRSIAPPLTDADQRAYAAYARTRLYRPDAEVPVAEVPVPDAPVDGSG